jgi:hypothetical protein
MLRPASRLGRCARSGRAPERIDQMVSKIVRELESQVL